MKIRKLLSKSLLLACVCTSPLMAQDIQQTLSNVPAPEMAAKAAELVSKSSKELQDQTTVRVVTAALAARPTLAASVVGAIAKSNPDQAVLAASIAAKNQPAQVGVITKAACAAAPGKTQTIVAALCKQSPSDAKAIAVAAASSAPDKANEILAAVSAAIPSLRIPIDNALAKLNGGPVDVAAVLTAALSANGSVKNGRAVALKDFKQVGVSGATPNTPGGGSPSGITPGGSLNYSAP